MERRKTKKNLRWAKRGLIRKAESGQETEEQQKINRRNYAQEHRGGLGQ